MYTYRNIFGIFAILCAFIPSSIHAATVWTKEGSPYILEKTVEFDDNEKLVINAGVVVMSASTTPGSDPFSIQSWGGIEIKGTEAEPVRLIGLGAIFTGKNSLIEYADMDGAGIVTSHSTTTIRSSKIRRMPLAIEITRGALLIENSEITDNQSGIYSRKWGGPPVLVMSGDRGKEIGGFGEWSDDPDQNHISIHNSIFERNQNSSIKNDTENIVDATENWWGTSAGPGLQVIGAVTVEPWKMTDPRIKTECCSNVIFIPGFEGTRLYRKEGGVFGTSTNRLWEPNRNADVQKLFLDSDGVSIDPTIFTGDVMGSALGVKDIYKNFIATMNGVVAEKTINEWLPFAYDWRMSVEDVVLKGNLVKEVERLALSSRTGKVSIVAHSNGGLIARALGMELEKIGKSGLLDKVLFVASPLLGTPQAIAGMLHGDGQSILGGFILRSGVARTLGINMPGAYGLLPSQEYFSKITNPVLTFFGKAVTSYQSYVNYLTSGRVQPKESDLKSPALLLSGIFSKIEKIHSIIDAWKFPTATKVVSLVGWGLPTIQSVEYSSSSPRVNKSPEGDGTVLVGSAAAYPASSSILYYNLGLFNRETKKGIDHANILESDTLRNLISKALATSSASVSTLPPYITAQKPEVKNYPWMSWITVSVHSPVDLDIYDSRGGHMGLVQIPDSDVEWLENTIGGQYDFIGDEKYFTLPADETYTVKLKGTGVGPFTFQIQKFVGENMTEVANVIYPTTQVHTSWSGEAIISPTDPFPVLKLHGDTTNTSDYAHSPNTLQNQYANIDAIKSMILSLKLNPSVESSLFTRTESVRVYMRQLKKATVIEGLQILIDKVKGTHWTTKELPDSARQILLPMYENVLALVKTWKVD